MADLPTVVNRHHFANHDEIPPPWIYIGRGTPLGNPYLLKDHGEERCMRLYKKWLWEHIQKRNERILAELRRITPRHRLACSCAPRPCHGDVVVQAWVWARKKGLLSPPRETYEQAERAALQDAAFH